MTKSRKQASVNRLNGCVGKTGDYEGRTPTSVGRPGDRVLPSYTWSIAVTGHYVWEEWFIVIYPPQD